jgi:endo-alpha-1,4-polygalactosaminidase (GH114 family)
MKPEEKKTLKAPADVDRLVAYRSLAAGDSYRVFWECLRKK